jgi:hypothetical protein
LGQWFHKFRKIEACCKRRFSPCVQHMEAVESEGAPKNRPEILGFFAGAKSVRRQTLFCLFVSAGMAGRTPHREEHSTREIEASQIKASGWGSIIIHSTCYLSNLDAASPQRRCESAIENPVQANGADERGGSFAQSKTLAHSTHAPQRPACQGKWGRRGHSGVGPRPIPDTDCRTR